MQEKEIERLTKDWRNGELAKQFKGYIDNVLARVREGIRRQIEDTENPNEMIKLQQKLRAISEIEKELFMDLQDGEIALEELKELED